MKYIREYQIFESSATAPAALTAVQITWLDKCAAGRWKLNPQTGLIDVDGRFNCGEQGLTDLKGVKFGKVGGSFYCHRNRLTSLDGAPQSVGGDFYCNGNQLTSLVGAPQIFGGDFYCSNNQLTTLEGAPPRSVSGNFVCYGNPVSESTLKGIFELMKKGMAYQQALEKCWSEMGAEDRELMYKDHHSLTPEDARKYKALATYSNIKSYL